jgi:signal transduction histidine kinase
MSGMKNKSFTYQKRFYILSAVYLSGVIFILCVIHQIPTIYTKISQEYNQTTLRDVNQIMETSSVDTWDTQLEELVNDGIIDIVVLNQEAAIYQSKPSMNFDKLHAYINERQISLERTYTKTINETEYQIWLAVYPVSPVDVFSTLIGILGIGIVILCILTVLLFQIAFKRLIKPIRDLKKRIKKLRKYQFQVGDTNTVHSEYDILSHELEEFALDLDDKLKEFNIQHTDLEYQLEANKESGIMKKELVRALIHSLKSPLNISLMESEEIRKEIMDPNALYKIESIMKSNENVLLNINEILNIMNSDEKRSYLDKEYIELIKIVKQTIQLFKPIFNAKRIIFSMETPKEIWNYINPIVWKQILHNIISNASSYTDEGGIFEISIFEENNQIHIHAYNDKKDYHEIDFERVFDIFYHISDANKYSSGVGLYTVRNLVENCRGNCQFLPKGAGVELIVRLPKDGNKNEKE